MTADRWLDCADLAAHLNVSKGYVQTQVTAGRYPHHRVGRLVRFSPADVRAIERAAEVTPTSLPRRLRSTA